METTEGLNLELGYEVPQDFELAPCFGIDLERNDELDVMDVAARLFVSLRISVDTARKFVNMIENGELTRNKFLKMTDAYFCDVRRRIDNGENIAVEMKTKLEEWTDEFAAPTDDDYDYLEAKYAITKIDLFGPDYDIHKPIIRSAKELAAKVKEFVKGQDDCIDNLAVSFFQHLESKRNRTPMRIKCPVVLMGATGSGKSEILRRFGMLCDCPVIRINTIDVVPNGWKGTRITDVFSHCLDKYSLGDLEYAIVEFHEIDKIVHYQRAQNRSDDMDGDMMREIMRFLETDYSIMLEKASGMMDLETKKFDLPTQNMLLVFDGAFVKMDEIVKKRMNVASTIGYGQNKQEGGSKENYMKYVTEDDMVTWGFMPELVGRIGQIQALNPLSSDIIYQIMTTAKESVLKDHIEYCQSYNINICFDESALRYISDIAYNSGMGFRNVKTLLSKCMNSIYYEYCCSTSKNSNKKPLTIKIDKEYVARQLKVSSK